MPAPFGGAVLLSDFTGANENPLSQGGNWAITNSLTNPVQLISNAVSGVINGQRNSSYWTPATFGPDVAAYCTLSTFVSAGAGIVVRLGGAGGAGTWDGYLALPGNPTIIRRVDNDVFTQIASVAITWANGDKVGITAIGTEIAVWRFPTGGSDWTKIVAASDSTYTLAGNVALYAGSTTTRMDDFYVGPPSQSSDDVPPHLLGGSGW